MFSQTDILHSSIDYTSTKGRISNFCSITGGAKYLKSENTQNTRIVLNISLEIIIRGRAEKIWSKEPWLTKVASENGTN